MVEQRILNFYSKGLNHGNELIQFVFRNSLLTPSSIVKNVNFIIKKHNISYNEIFNGIKFKLNNHVNAEPWKINFINEVLLLIDNGNYVPDFAFYEFKQILNYLCTY